MATKGQRAKKVEKRNRAKLKEAKTAAKIGIQDAGKRFAHHEAKALQAGTPKPKH